MGAQRFDIKAKAAGKAKAEELRLMLQSLPAERFQLKAHREMKEMSGYALPAAKSGFKLKPAEGEGSSVNSNRGAGTAKATFTALNEQLGLRLERRKLPVSILVVDSISKTPTGN